MSSCPNHSACAFVSAVEPSLVKRIRFSSAYLYCKGGRHEQCAIFARLARGESAPSDLLPDGSTGTYLDEAPQTVADRRGARFLVVDDSPVFASIAANAVRQRYPDADVAQCHCFEDAEPLLRSERFTLIVSGAGLGGNRGVGDVRRLSSAPIVLFTGRTPDGSAIPSNTRVVTKDAGPTALRAAIEDMLAARLSSAAS